MLPYLHPRKMGSIIMATRKPDGGTEVKGEAGEPNQALMGAMEDMIRAVHAKDAKGAAEAFEAACSVCNDDSGEQMGPPESDE